MPFRSARWARLGLGLLLIVMGCGGPAPQAPPRGATAAIDDLTAARAAMARGDYAAALPLLRKAVAVNPNNLEARYRLGVTASYLGLVDDATAEFQWVVAHGAPNSSEVRMARDWLARAATADVPVVAAKTEEQPQPDRANLSGKVLGEAGGGSQPLARFPLILKGAPNTPVSEEWHIFRTESDGSYRFRDLLPGDYLLADGAAGPPGWRLKVTLKAGDDLVLDLNPQNNAKIRNDFPDSK